MTFKDYLIHFIISCYCSISYVLAYLLNKNAAKDLGHERWNLRGNLLFVAAPVTILLLFITGLVSYYANLRKEE